MSNMGIGKEVSVQSASDRIQSEDFFTRSSRSYLIAKRSLDITISLVGIILTLPICIVLWFFYQFGDNKGPLIFKQKRVGKDGEFFYIYKFRSMIVDADKKLRENKVLYQKYIKNNYKLEPEEDPRITRLGGFLRKTSLDELPQLINVIQGKMSLVGPRPVVEEELEEYGVQTSKFLSVKPGVTGFWQVSGRSSVGYPDRVDLELYYVDNQSFIFDLKILIKTVVMVITKKGAY